MRSGSGSAFLLLIATGCGDSTPPPMDAGADAFTPSMDARIDAPSDAGVTEIDAGPPPRCPARLVTEILPRASVIDYGWSGATHDWTLGTGTGLTLSVEECADPASCDCRLGGPVRNPRINNQRCLAAPNVECTSDADCESGDRCVFFLGPPSQRAASTTGACGVPVPALCVLVAAVPTDEHEEAVDGTYSPGSGRATLLHLDLLIASYIGDCPTCDGDDGLADGAAGGTCSTGGACDAHSISTTAPAITSFDCVPSGSPLISSLPLVDLQTATRIWSLTSASPPCTDPEAAGQRCYCSLCDVPAGKACRSDEDCDEGGTCGGLAPAVDTKPNSCAGACGSTFPGLCGGLGSCSCFGTEIVANGHVASGTEPAVVAGFGCLPPTGNAAQDQIAGLPGPIRFEIALRAEEDWP